MAQVKKDDVRAAILNGADALFRERGYSAATLRAVAKRSKVSLANIYVYFESKLEIIFALYAPWFMARLERLEAEALALPDPNDRLRLIIAALWRDMPTEDGGMAVNLMQALSSALPDDRYDPSLIKWAEEKIARLLGACVPADRDMPPAALQEVAHVLFMAFDGFTISRRLHAAGGCTDATIDAVCRLIAPQAMVAKASKTQSAKSDTTRHTRQRT
jgi:AcrR family transcriptional regulator